MAPSPAAGNGAARIAGVIARAPIAGMPRQTGGTARNSADLLPVAGKARIVCVLWPVPP
jgi:hypothetical protein